ncbi:DUF2345 domain-containing protein [Deefgea salmonis]|uniref:DUF2345 domain-containing protein n=1 Tax=Deefgea salmonis TaxID=2875502 RepID=A0ABS8BP87_9NEIS|nr:DUF2345 domain-containing protein [Deefgea salmonis]MCB5197544.1 DUF2345 domain-containing protein [Deefgea salmonis]
MKDKVTIKLITVVAKDEILVTAGGGYIRLKGGNIEIHCPSTVSVKSANHNSASTSNASTYPAALQR